MCNCFHILPLEKCVSLNTRNWIWGTEALKAVSERLRKVLPGLRGNGEAQLSGMRLFHKGWSFFGSNSSVATDELQNVVNAEDILGLIKSHRQRENIIGNASCQQ